MHFEWITWAETDSIKSAYCVANSGGKAYEYIRLVNPPAYLNIILILGILWYREKTCMK